jgi:hypothetical protein
MMANPVKMNGRFLEAKMLLYMFDLFYEKKIALDFLIISFV